jgi:hypothetical protein
MFSHKIVGSSFRFSIRHYLRLADHHISTMIVATNDLSIVAPTAHSSVEERIAYSNGKMDAEQQILAEWKSNVEQLEHENQTLKAKLSMLVQQDKEEVTLLPEHITALKAEVAKLVEDILTLKASKPKSAVQPTEPDEMIHRVASNDREELTSATKPQSKSSTGGPPTKILSKTAPVSLILERMFGGLVSSVERMLGGLVSSVAKLEQENLTLKDAVAQSPRVWLGVVMMVFAIFGYMMWPSGCHGYGVLPKTAPVWKSSASTISTGRDRDRMIDVLDFPGVQKGIYTWKIKILREDGGRLGVVSAVEHIYERNLGHHGAFWGYGGRGDAFHNGFRVGGWHVGFTTRSERNLGHNGASWGYGGHGDAFHNDRRVGGWHVGFTTGSIVTFSLDLTGRGTLSVSVDEKPMIRVFDDMKKGNEQFIPAAFLYNDARIEFLGFQ